MPVPVTVALQTGVDDSVNPTLTRRFVEGLRRAGVTMSQQGNMTLNMAVAIASEASAPAGPISGTYRGFDWVSGEQAPQGQANIRSANLTLSVTLSDNAQFTQSWVATAKCVVQTDDSGALAEDIGELIGRNIGQNFDSRRM
jgi:hypothetical protein